MRRIYCGMAVLVLISTLAPAQSIKQKDKSGNAKSGAGFQIAAATVTGAGTTNFLPKWVGSPGASVLGDSAVFEDKFGKVGIGTTSPTSLLTVKGMIEITMGGLKFPDGTIQSSAFTAVNHDTTLKGDGSAANPLGLAAVNHDTTFQGEGSLASPLGLAVPLIFSGSVDNGNGVITVTNIAAGAPGIFATGGNSSPTVGGGSGVVALGGSGTAAPGGAGLVSFGGNASGGSGGTGGSLIGGVGSNTGNGGDGLFSVGALGTGVGKKGGRGIVAIAGGGAGGATPGLAGDFVGDVSISGNISKGGGSFKIDHPLDPENKYLYHSFVESPDMMNIYNGNVTTDQAGEAVVVLPDWFEALNKSFRYQLTVVGTFARAIVAEKVKDNRFTIRTDAPNVEVSWQVTGIRKDAYAEKHRIPVEEEKAAPDRGAYLHPDAFDKPEEKGIAFRRAQELMQTLKASSSEVKVRQQNQ